jgi:uncharacterized membrane protein YuzA (DUF378 family)
LLPRRKHVKIFNIITLALIIVGGLNWGLVGLFGFDLVAAIFGPGSGLSHVVYILVGISAAWQIMPLLAFMSSHGAATKRAR